MIDKVISKFKVFTKKRFLSIQSWFFDLRTKENPKYLLAKQYIYLVLGIFILCLAITTFFIKIPIDGKKERKWSVEKPEEIDDGHKVKLATDSIRSEKKWQNYLEDRIDEEQKVRDKQLKKLEHIFHQKEESIKSFQTTEFEDIRTQLNLALKELERLRHENSLIMEELTTFVSEEKNTLPPQELSMFQLQDDEEISLPESNYDYIPATSYVTGRLLGGIAVSTAVSASSAAIPVIIRLESRGNLPKDFTVNIKDCRILGSCYGDISSERAIIRAEEMVCEDKLEELVITTRVAGVIYGDDGMNGIRGSVVSMSEKHLKNALTSGLLSGFASIAKEQSNFNITSLGAVSTRKKSEKDMLKTGLAGGFSGAAEKLADYHIKLAENISPVILIPGGTKVDVMFTKGVRIGSKNIKNRLAKARDRSN